MVRSTNFVVVRKKTKPNDSLLILEIKWRLNRKQEKKNQPPSFPGREICHISLDMELHSETMVRTYESRLIPLGFIFL